MKEGAQSTFASPLRYPGGKGKLANYVKLIFHQNGLVGHEYAEPYAGGASVALSLLFEEYAPAIHVNDLNRSVHAFWKAVLTNTDALCKRLRDVDVSIEEWQRQREVQLDQSPDDLDLAFSTLFLNRTNRSGILAAGVIGGKQQNGRWKLDARFSKSDLISRIEKIARFRSRIALTNLDAAIFLSEHVSTLPAKTFLYLDPPYMVKGEGLYEHFYKPEDHRAIAALIQAETRPWIVSYDSDPLALELYGSFKRLTYNLPYSASIRTQGSEEMFFSPNVMLPDLASPTKIPRKLISQAKLAFTT